MWSVRNAVHWEMADSPAINAFRNPSSVSPIAVFTLMPVTTTRLFINQHLGDREGGQPVAAPRLPGGDHRVVVVRDSRVQGHRVARAQRRDEAGVMNMDGADRAWRDVVRDVGPLTADKVRERQRQLTHRLDD